MTVLRLPEGITKEQVNIDQPLLLYPGGVKATYQNATQWRSRRGTHTSIFAFFDKAEFMDSVPDDGTVQLHVFGQMISGQYFYGDDRLRIVSWEPWNPCWEFDDFD